MAFPKYIFAPIQVTWRETADLVIPWRHSPYVHRHRAALIISRIQVIAAIFAILIPLWIIVDALAFDRWVWTAIAPLRLASAALCLALVWPRRINDPRPAAVIMLICLLIMPPLFYLISVPIIAHASPDGISGFVRNLYEFLPYTVVAGLSIFPLTALEVMACWLVVFLAMLAGQLYEHMESWTTLAGPMWLLLLIGGTAMVSGMSQLQYMIALVRRVTFDALTGALTRRAGAELLEGQFRHSLQNEVPLTLAFVDIDRFKQINDSFGHDAGDQMLRHVALQLHNGLRQGDTLIRWGGEEFLVVLAGTDREGARMVVSRLGKLGFGARPDGQLVTVCIGLAERLTDGSRDVNELIETADRRMYEAKIAGRNRAVFGQGDILVGVVGSDDASRSRPAATGIPS
jgi:diguanylate cyclase (GGDEF)-like protein